MTVNSSVIDDLLKKYVSSDKDAVDTIRIAAFIVTGKNGIVETFRQDTF